MRNIEDIFQDPDDVELQIIPALPRDESELRDELVDDDWPFGEIPYEVLQKVWAWAWGTPETEPQLSLTAEETELFEWFRSSEEHLPLFETLQLGPGKVVVDRELFLRKLAMEILEGTKTPRIRLGTLQSELRELRRAIK